MVSRPRLVERTGFGAVPAADASSFDPSPPGLQSDQALVASPLSMVPQEGPGDVRDRPLRVVSSERIDLIRRVVGVSAVEDQDKLLAIVDAMDAVSQQTSRVLNASVIVGREIGLALGKLSPGEAGRAVRASGALFPGWSASNVVKLVAAARFFDSNVVPQSALPVTYSVLYELSRVKPDDLRAAVERNVITPAMTFRQAEAFRKLRYSGSDYTPTPEPPRPLPPEAVRLDAEITALKAKVRSLQTQRARVIAREAASPAPRTEK